MFSYELKSDLAIISSLISLILWVYTRHAKKKQEVIEAYETVYDDVIFLINYPLNEKRGEIKEFKYSNEDKKLEKAVREYLDAHFFGQLYIYGEIYSNDLKIDEKKKEFIDKVKEEANKFNENNERHSNLKTPHLSPVYYVDNPVVIEKMDRILRYVGRNLTKFKKETKYCWLRTHDIDPKEVVDEYEKGMQFCPNYYEHNPRDLFDPYYDIIIGIRSDYRKLTTKRIDSLKDKLILKKDIYKYKVRNLSRYVFKKVVSVYYTGLKFLYSIVGNNKKR
jgi:hypothetical protein